MRRLTAIILPLFSLALATGAHAATAAAVEVTTPSLDRSDAPPQRAQARTFTPEQARRLAERVDRMTPRMRQAVLGRLAKMADSPDDATRIRRAGPPVHRADADGARRELREGRSRRHADRRDATRPMHGKADGRRDGRRARPDHDRRDVGEARTPGKNRSRSAKRSVARDRDQVRRVRTGERARSVERSSEGTRRDRDDRPRLRRANDADPEISTRKRSSPSERRRRD